MNVVEIEQAINHRPGQTASQPASQPFEELETLPTLARRALATVPVLNSSPWLGSFSLPGTDCTPYAEARRYSYRVARLMPNS